MTKIKIFTILLLCSSITFSSVSNIFAISISKMGLDQSLISTYIAEDESQNTEIIKVVDNFIDNYIKPNMTDLEKEIEIIKYLVANVSYDEEELMNDISQLNDSYKAYGALVNHRAVCSGYAKAFDLLAKKSGLSAIVVTGEATNTLNYKAPHAWNQIYLDGEWYNVDVTFEDPITEIEMGYDELFNNYINITDAEISADHVRENGHTCTATKYGKNVVAYYLYTGKIDLNASLDDIRKDYEKQILEFTLSDKEEEMNEVIDKLLIIGAKYENNENYFEFSNDLEMTNYIIKKLALSEQVITVVTDKNSKDKFSIDKEKWLDDYMTIPGKCTMHKIFSSDGKKDTRILVFQFEK